MAQGTKGVTLRLSNSSDLLEIQSSVLKITTIGLGFQPRVLSSNVGEVDFVALGFTTKMKIRTNSTNNTGVYTVRAVNATNINFKETSDLVSEDNSTTLSITGHNMEEIGEIVSIDGPSGSVNVIDITNLGSTAREKLVGIQDEGQVSMEVLSNFTTGSTEINQWKLRDLRQQGTLSFFDLVFADETRNDTAEPSAYSWEGFVTNYGNAVALDDAVKTAITLEISSQAHFIPAISS